MLYVLYGRKSKRHNWNVQGYDQHEERIAFLRECFLRDAKYSHWDNVQTEIVQFDSLDILQALPDNIRQLP